MKTAEEMRKIALEARLKMQEAARNHAEEILTTSVFPNIKKMAERGHLTARVKTNARAEIVAIIKGILIEYGYKVDIVSNFILIGWQE
jgi:hypothetical protein